MSPATSLVSGLAGAAALTALHEGGRRVLPHPPRMDLLGMRALLAARRGAGADTEGTSPGSLYAQTLVGDLVSNSAYYALVGAGDARGVWWRGAALGTLAGVGALLLPRRLGLGDPPDSHVRSNQVLTVAWYLLGGLAAACTAAALDANGRAADR